MTSRLEQDLGIDSLARIELSLRIERAFRRRLPPSTVGAAETLGDLLNALTVNSSPARTRLGRTSRRTRSPACSRCEPGAKLDRRSRMACGAPS